MEAYYNKVSLAMKTMETYELQRTIIEEYILVLESCIGKDPMNIKAICQLAIAYYEDRRDIDTCIELMETALSKYESSIEESSLCLLLTNLAYFYDEEYGRVDKTIELLQRALQLPSCTGNSYYALAYHLVDSDSKYALEVIKAMPTGQNTEHHHLFLKAYTLMINEQYNDAMRLFQNLSVVKANEEIQEKALYCLAILKNITGKRDEAIAIAEKLYIGFMKDENEEVLEFELIHLHFLLEKYDKVVKLFRIDKQSIYIGVEDMKLYLYALKKVNLEFEGEATYLNKIDEINRDIADTLIDDDFSAIEKEAYIDERYADIANLKAAYLKIYLENEAIKIDDVFYACKGRKHCYLIGCPRHS